MKTIKEMRENDAVKLAEKLNPNPTPEEIEKARHALRLYYRFTGYYQTAFYVSQERTATESQRENADSKSDRAFERAKKALWPYGVEIRCPGLYPCLDNVDGTSFTYGHFYN